MDDPVIAPVWEIVVPVIETLSPEGDPDDVLASVRVEPADEPPVMVPVTTGEVSVGVVMVGEDDKTTVVVPVTPLLRFAAEIGTLVALVRLTLCPATVTEVLVRENEFPVRVSPVPAT